jgi:hypothetical protein
MANRRTPSGFSGFPENPLPQGAVQYFPSIFRSRQEGIFNSALSAELQLRS